MMTLADMTSYVTGKMEQTDAASVAACQTFLDVRYRMIWDAQLWRDTLTVVNGTFNVTQVTGSYPPLQILINQTGIERVLKVIDASGDPTVTLAPADPQLIFDTDPSRWGSGNTPVQFIMLPPAVCFPFVGQRSGAQLTASTDNPIADQAANITITGTIGGTGTLFQEQVTFMGATTGSSVGVYNEVFSIGKDVTAGNITVTDGGPFTYVLRPFETSAPQYPRIALMDNAGLKTLSSAYPAGTRALIMLCKRRCPGLLFPSAAPTLQNIERALIDFAEADLLERNRQYGKSQAKLQSANSQLTIAYDLERGQSANETRIIPADIHGEQLIGGFTDKTHW